ncbi:MAG: tetratricopeptide repeat protein [Bacteroidales bacterium]|nr:tetratricopeptide repeat protein [Bacteroidales bacterium]
MYKIANGIKATNLKEAYELASKALEYAELSNYFEGICKNLILIGSMKLTLGDHIGALNCFNKAYDYAITLKNRNYLAEIYYNIGNVYYLQKKFNLAIYYLKKSLEKIEGEISNLTLNNLYRLGQIYELLENYRDAYRCYRRSLSIEELNKNYEGILYSLLGISSISIKQKDFLQAKISLNRALKIAQKLRSYLDISLIYSLLGDIYKDQANYKESLKYYSLALKIADSLQAINSKRDYYFKLANVNQQLNKYKDAYNFLNLYIKVSDTIQNEETRKQLLQLHYKFELKNKEQEIKILKEKEQKIRAERNYLIVSSLIFFVMIITLINFYIQRTRYNKKLRQQYNEIASKTKELNAALKELEVVNTQLKQSNNQIMDGLHYASVLQKIMIPFEKHLGEVFPQSIVLNKPKVIVSGDFGWIFHKGNFVFISIADSIGHGIASALVSIKAYNLLNEASIHITENTLPSDILSFMNKNWNKHNKETKISEDGLEIVIIKIDLNSYELSFSSANLSFATVENNTVSVHEGDKVTIGEIPDDYAFLTKKIKISKNTKLFLYTDGFVDQYKEVYKNKYLDKLFDNLIYLSKSDYENQKNHINALYEELTSKFKQTDDIMFVLINF